MSTAISRDELHAGIEAGGVTVVDALPPAPFGQRHLPSAVNVVAEDADEHVRAALPDPAAAIVTYSTDDHCTRGPELALGPTASLFDGHRHAGVDASIFVTRTPPGRAVELHTHPYAETFVLLAGRGRWTVGDDVTELEADELLVAPADTPHGFRNVGSTPLLVVSVHERGTVRSTWLGEEPS